MRKMKLSASGSGKSRRAPELLAALLAATPQPQMLSLCVIDLKSADGGLRDLILRAIDRTKGGE